MFNDGIIFFRVAYGQSFIGSPLRLHRKIFVGSSEFLVTLQTVPTNTEMAKKIIPHKHSGDPTAVEIRVPLGSLSPSPWWWLSSQWLP